MDLIAFTTFVFTLASAALAAVAFQQASRATKALESLRREMPTDARVRGWAAAVVQEAAPGLVERVLGATDLRRLIASQVQSEVGRGSIAVIVKQAVEAQCKNMALYIEEEALPRALEKSGPIKVAV